VTKLRIHIEGGDLLQQDSIRSTVREIYGAVRPGDRRVAERFYPARDLEWLPDETVRAALGVGNPVAHAELRAGEDVLDLGSGGGIDCLLARRAVGQSGSVVGVDFLEEMVDRGRRAAVAAGLSNVRFVRGEIEDLPLPDESVDVVISNGVPNLSPRKSRVMSEAYRVLRPGGRLAIVDLLLEAGLPPEIQTHPAAWAGCLSGALSERAMYTAMRRAGFRAVSIEASEPFGIDECALYPLFTPALLDLLRRLVPADRLDRIATSTVIRARKPAGGEALPGRAPHGRGAVGTSPHP
jgi:SAM-dependent methyltransferase